MLNARLQVTSFQPNVVLMTSFEPHKSLCRQSDTAAADIMQAATNCKPTSNLPPTAPFAGHLNPTALFH